ncbi:hypothetical protein IAW_05825 [Bacillus cereus str. Schrouff]|nr:hypothetical protein IAW_05825 [Bacillus cereus str. Schrouff]EOO81660.1 hypothetical protein IGY_05682 [Bacillus cereus K-5975c]
MKKSIEQFGNNIEKILLREFAKQREFYRRNSLELKNGF